ncbi:hypothetical protein ACFL2Q_08835 [Thermodesulfobacteriota bacterium]
MKSIVAAALVGLLVFSLASFSHAEDNLACRKLAVETTVKAFANGLGKALKSVSDEKARVALIRDFVSGFRFLPD